MIISHIIDIHKYNKQLRFGSELIFRKIPNSHEEIVLNFLFLTWQNPEEQMAPENTSYIISRSYLITQCVRSDKPHLFLRLSVECVETQRKDFLNCAKKPTKSLQ